MERRRGIADRLVFAKGQQRRFLMEARKQLGYSNWTEMSSSFDFHRRSLSDWAKEKWRISEEAAMVIAARSGVVIPATVKPLKWQDHARRAGRIGNAVIQQKYSGPLRTFVDEKYRQSQWQKWWEQKGQYLPSPIDNTP